MAVDKGRKPNGLQIIQSLWFDSVGRKVLVEHAGAVRFMDRAASALDDTVSLLWDADGTMTIRSGLFTAQMKIPVVATAGALGSATPAGVTKMGRMARR